MYEGMKRQGTDWKRRGGWVNANTVEPGRNELTRGQKNVFETPL